jgi:hypothetical protein
MDYIENIDNDNYIKLVKFIVKASSIFQETAQFIK